MLNFSLLHILLYKIMRRWYELEINYTLFYLIIFISYYVHFYVK